MDESAIGAAEWRIVVDSEGRPQVAVIHGSGRVVAYDAAALESKVGALATAFLLLLLGGILGDADISIRSLEEAQLSG